MANRVPTCFWMEIEIVWSISWSESVSWTLLAIFLSKESCFTSLDLPLWLASVWLETWLCSWVFFEFLRDALVGFETTLSLWADLMVWVGLVVLFWLLISWSIVFVLIVFWLIVAWLFMIMFLERLERTSSEGLTWMSTASLSSCFSGWERVSMSWSSFRSSFSEKLV